MVMMILEVVVVILAMAVVDGEPDDFGVKSKGVDVVPFMTASAEDVSSSPIVDNVGETLCLLCGDSCSLYTGLSVRLKPGDLSLFKSLGEPFENLLHKFTNDWVIVTMAI